MRTQTLSLISRLVIQTCIIIGYILFGYFWIKILIIGIGGNYFFDIFQLKVTETAELKWENNDQESEVTYSYIVKSKEYSEVLEVNIESFKEKVDLRKDKAIVLYNKYLPEICYLKGWKLTSYYRFTFIMFSIFLFFIIFVDRVINSDHYLRNHLKEIMKRNKTTANNMQ